MNLGESNRDMHTFVRVLYFLHRRVARVRASLPEPRKVCLQISRS